MNGQHSQIWIAELLDPTDVLLQLNRAVVIEALEGADAAEQEFRRLLKIFPNNGEVLQEVGGFYKRRGATAEALAAFKQAEGSYSEELAKKPDYITYYNRGLVNENQYRWDRAIKDYTEAIRINRHQATAYRRRAGCYFETQEYEKAIADYTRVAKRETSDVYAYYNIALCHCEMKEYPEALAECEKGVKESRRILTGTWFGATSTQFWRTRIGHSRIYRRRCSCRMTAKFSVSAALFIVGCLTIPPRSSLVAELLPATPVILRRLSGWAIAIYLRETQQQQEISTNERSISSRTATSVILQCCL